MSDQTACPCGSGHRYEDCCGPHHRGTHPAATPEELMRSRYSAFALGDATYLLGTWHPRTRPADLELDPAITWLSLQVLDVRAAEVEFIARYRGPGGRGFLRERSRFARQDGHWFYVDGTTG